MSAVGFALDPIASYSGQVPLAPPANAPLSQDVPSPVGVRPWGLRTLRTASGEAGEWMGWSYDHEEQVAVDATGRPVVDRVIAGPPTAYTTSSVDGEDPPSSEDWVNDFTPDDPGLPA